MPARIPGDLARQRPEQRPPRYWLHRVLAHPCHIAWVVGTLGLWVPLTMALNDAGVFGSLTADWLVIPRLVVCYAAVSGLGFFAGLFTVFWFIVALSVRVNGAPHEVGESVLVLVGSHAGRVSTNYEITIGQGGQPLPRVDLGAEAREKCLDIYAPYQLLRTSPKTPL